MRGRIVALLLYVTRSYMTILSGVAVVLGGYISGLAWNNPELLMIAAAQTLIVAAVFQWNEITDRDHDYFSLVYKPVAEGHLNYRVIVPFIVLEVSAAFALAATVPLVIAIFIVQCILSFFFYGRLKKASGLAGNVLTAILFASVLVVGAVLTGNYSLCLAIATVAALFIVGREVIKDILDMNADSIAGRNTLPLIYGAEFSRDFGFAFMGTGALILAYLSYRYQSLLGVVICVLLIALLVYSYRQLTTLTPQRVLLVLRVSAGCLLLGMFSFVLLK